MTRHTVAPGVGTRSVDHLAPDVELRIGEIVVQGAALTRRERDHLAAVVEREVVAALSGRPDRPPDGGSASARVEGLGRHIAAGIAGPVASSLARGDTP